MADKDALGSFDFSKVTKGGLFLKWEAGKAVTLRVLTLDPLVTTKEFTNDDGEVNLSTQFHFIVYNWTDKAAQILSATPTIARKIGDFHKDPDFGSNIREIDIKITPTGEKLTRKYDIQVLPKANVLGKEELEQLKKIELEKAVPDGERMSFYNPDKQEKPPRAVPANGGDDDIAEMPADDEPINLDDIPY